MRKWCSEFGLSPCVSWLRRRKRRWASSASLRNSDTTALWSATCPPPRHRWPTPPPDVPRSRSLPRPLMIRGGAEETCAGCHFRGSIPGASTKPATLLVPCRVGASSAISYPPSYEALHNAPAPAHPLTRSLFPRKAADLNGDGVINREEYALLKQAGTSSTFKRDFNPILTENSRTWTLPRSLSSSLAYPPHPLVLPTPTGDAGIGP